MSNYQCIKGPTIESIVCSFISNWKHCIMQLNLIIGMVSQYYVLFDLFYAGDHTRCAPIKDIIVTLMCVDLMMNCIVGLKIYHKYYYWNNQLNRYFNLTIYDIYPLLSVPFVWNLSCFSNCSTCSKLCDVFPK